MSTSTVSATPNPTSRRRPLHSSSAAAAIDLLGSELRNIQSVNLGNENKDAGVENSTRTLRSKDPVRVKEGSVNDAASPRRSKKVVKPLWRSALSVFFKNFVLLIVLLGFVQVVYRLAVRSGGGDGGGGGDVQVGSGSEAVVVELEGRMAEIERAWKRTVKMMQVQVEVVDAKFENRVAGLREEIGKRIEEKNDLLESELSKLDAKVDSLGSELRGVRLNEFLTKEEFETFYEKLKSAGSGEKEFSLDDVRDYAREVVETEIQKHAADGLGMVDYALALAGGRVVKHSEPFGVEKGSWVNMMNLGHNKVHQDAVKMLTPSFGEPGQCFPLKGSHGFVQIRLRTAIIPEAFTLEHVSKSVAYDRSSAPKDCRVSGWLEGPEVINNQTNAEKMFLLSEFTYDLGKSNAQTYPVSGSASGSIVNMIRIDFASNHGSPSHTCIYRLRVHGQEPKAVSMVETQS